MMKCRLREVRQRRGITQKQLEAKLGTPQNAISRIEHQHDMKVSTLTNYVEALGGELLLVAKFDNLEMEIEVLERGNDNAE